MTESEGPAVRRLRLRTELRRLREEAGLSRESVVEKLGWSLSKLARIESGAVGIVADDVEAVLRVYGVEEPTQVQAMLSLTGSGRPRKWWNAYKDVLTPSHLRFIALEAEAVEINHCAPLVLPGLLQTEDYIRAIIRRFRVGESPEERVEKLVAIRLTRQQQLMERPDRPRLTFVLDEAALRRPVGGQAVMQRQLEHLVKLLGEPNIAIEVVPFEIGAYPGMKGPSTILKFGAQAQSTVLYVEGPAGDMLYRDDERELREHDISYAQMRTLSLGPEGSRRLIEKLIQKLD
ncbi:MAG: helix-turn-helix domain-containing protein [Mycobacteriales bacterium]